MRTLLAFALIVMAVPANAQDSLSLRLEGERLNGVGEWDEAKSRLDAAIKAYEASDAEPEALSLAYSALSTNRSGAKDYIAAAAATESELEIVRSLTGKRDADSRDEDLASTIEKLAYFRRESGRYDLALPAQAEAVEINRRRVAEPDTADDQGAPALAESLSRLGEINWALGDKAAAIAAFEESLSLRRKIADERPAAVHSASVAELLEYLHIATGKKQYRDESLAILNPLPAYYGPKSDTWLRDLPKFGVFKE